jgi:hypothetical protein
MGVRDCGLDEAALAGKTEILRWHLDRCIIIPVRLEACLLLYPYGGKTGERTHEKDSQDSITDDWTRGHIRRSIRRTGSRLRRRLDSIVPTFSCC